MLNLYGDCKDRRTNELIMTNRFSQLYKSSAIKKNSQKISLQLSKNQTAVEVNGGGSSGYTLKNGPRKGQILKHLKTEPKKL